MNDAVTPAVESVWDYPRPPDVVPSNEVIEVYFAGHRIARTSHSQRVRETSHPPTYYLPRDAFIDGVLQPVRGTTFCEFKGVAHYFNLVADTAPTHAGFSEERVAPRAAWHYPNTTAGYEVLKEHVALMPGLVDSCTVDGERVEPQEGNFYGGWITSRVKGPFKGAPGTLRW